MPHRDSFVKSAANICPAVKVANPFKAIHVCHDAFAHLNHAVLRETTERTQNCGARGLL